MSASVETIIVSDNIFTDKLTSIRGWGHRRVPTYQYHADTCPPHSLWWRPHHRTLEAPRTGRCPWHSYHATWGFPVDQVQLERRENVYKIRIWRNFTNKTCCSSVSKISELIRVNKYWLAGEETLTGSSMYAGSPGPHLLHAMTLNRYSFPSITSVTVCSMSRMPVATWEAHEPL